MSQKLGVATRWWFLVFVVAASVLSSIAHADQSRYAVGVAVVDITPKYPIRLNGFGNRRTESEGVTQPIWAKALAIGTDEEKPLVLITIDSLGIRMPMVEEVAKRLKAKASIERERLAITFTHSHTTPKVNGACDTIFSSPIPPAHQQHIDRYTAELTDALEKVALAALSDRKPARLDWAVGNVGFAKNRRTPGGPVDHDLPMLVVREPESDKIRAIYVSYACHCVTLSNNLISGDWAGYAQVAIERNTPGAFALVSVGCGSDSNPSSGVTGDKTSIAAEQGNEIADEVKRLLQGPLKPITGQTSATLRNIDLPLGKLPVREELIALAAAGKAGSYNAQYQLAKLDRGEPLQSAIDYPIQTWSFDDSFAMVFLAGEVCVDYSLRLKQELDHSRLWLNGYANDFCCYVPSERLLKEGGYGGGGEIIYFGLPSVLAPGMENKIVEELRRQVPKSFHREGTTQQGNKHPTSPADALAAIRTRDDMVVELVVAEPQVSTPVAIDFGPDGRLWVAEMRDYSHGVDEKFEQTSCVRMLTDTDGDGKYEESTEFERGLRFPTDVKAWRQGVIVCDAPDVVYLEDTDGDGHADVRKVLLTGFATHNAQARVNSLRWGLDGWVYGSCGLFGGRIRNFKEEEVDLGSRDFRFKPDTGELEPVTGNTQQGRASNDWDDWFGCENGTLCKNYPLSDHYLARNPHIASPPTQVSVPAGPEANRLFTAGKLVLFKLSGAPGRPTAACGLDIYRDELLGASFRGNAFTAEPVNQLVHRLVLKPTGVTFAGLRPEDEAEQEFLASSDNWFRPVQVRTGLDGCLWVVDMCRYVVEHPRFIPAETLATLDPMAGRGFGRIYRVRPKHQSPRPTVRLDQLDTAGLVAALDSPNGPQRDLSQQLLIDRHDGAEIPPLEKLVLESQRPEARLQALCTLSCLGSLRADVVLHALKDAHAGVRRHAIRVSEPLVATSAAIGDALVALVDDEDAQVQLQLAYILGTWTDARAVEALATLARKHQADPYLLTAVLSSVNPKNVASFVRSVLSEGKEKELPAALRKAVITIAAKLGDDASARDAFAAFSRSTEGKLSTGQLGSVADFLAALETLRRTEFLRGANDAATEIGRVIADARQAVADSQSDEERALAALRVLAIATPGDADVSRRLGQLLGPQSSPSAQQAALKLLAGISGSQTGDSLLANWGGYTPVVRSQVLDVFFGRDDLLPLLLQGIADGKVKLSQFNASQRQRLLTHSNPEIRAGATAAFAGSINADRQKVIDTYAAATHEPGNATHGREVFGKHCANCHRLGDQGYVVGPNLAALTSHTPALLLAAVFDPNRAVDERYHSYLAVTDEGLTFTGILKGETSTSITLVEQQGKEHTLLRNSLEEFKDTGISLMPEGIEKDLSPADAADLFAYVATQGLTPKQVAGNRPEVVTPRPDGSIWLLASNCEIYGGDITFEPEFGNIGLWHGAGDQVAWDVDLPTDGKYEVHVEAACADDSAGNMAAIEGLDAPVQITVRTTGGWDNYQVTEVASTKLSAGRNRIIVRPAGTLTRPALMDLRGICLVPVDMPTDKRLAAILRQRIPESADATSSITKLLDGLAVGTPQEYDRIPDIWRPALEAGKRNDEAELKRLLTLALPEADAPLQHWQAVVLGGGVINGLSMQGIWPRQRLEELLQGNPSLAKRWARAIELADKMADDKAVPADTRYDALRILGATSHEDHGAHLAKYLESENDELQMGAVSGLADIEADAAGVAIASQCARYNDENRKLAVAALLRTPTRAALLQDLIDNRQIDLAALTEEQQTQLKTLLEKKP